MNSRYIPLLSCILCFCFATFAQNAPQNSTSQPEGTPSRIASSTNDDELHQLTAEINSLRSMMSAMRSQTAGIREEPVRAALLTEAQMWELVLNDMQRHVERLRAEADRKTK